MSIGHTITSRARATPGGRGICLRYADSFDAARRELRNDFMLMIRRPSHSLICLLAGDASAPIIFRMLEGADLCFILFYSFHHLYAKYSILIIFSMDCLFAVPPSFIFTPPMPRRPDCTAAWVNFTRTLPGAYIWRGAMIADEFFDAASFDTKATMHSINLMESVFAFKIVVFEREVCYWLALSRRLESLQKEIFSDILDVRLRGKHLPNFASKMQGNIYRSIMIWKIKHACLFYYSRFDCYVRREEGRCLLKF